MDRRRVGSSGLEVSRLALGTMTWSRDTNAEEAGGQIDAFLDAGGTLVDTAASYAGGGSESLIGELLGRSIARRDIQICTKAGIRTRDDGSGRVDASRDTLLATLDESLERLGTDYVDLWLVHAFDASVPLEETLHALEIAVNTGRVRYVGVSNFPGWAMAAAAAQSARPALACTEVEYSLAERGVEREVIPGAQRLGLGVLAWSPLGRGVLTGKYLDGIPADSRAASDHLAGFVEPYMSANTRAVVDALVTAAGGLETTPHELALAWVRDAPGVSAAIVGARTAAQLGASLRAESLAVPDAIRSALDEISAPPVGYPERART